MHPAIINKPALPLDAELSLPPDKSISHRAIFISAIAEGRTKINNFLFSGDCLVTINAFRKLGLRIITDKKNKRVIVYGKGLLGLSKPNSPLQIKESGTTMRLLAGLLAGQNFSSQLIAGKALSLRPMRRITRPLRMMGAVIDARSNLRGERFEEYPPLTLKGGGLKAISYRMPVASAQVKSAILLAGLYAKGQTKVIEPIKTRDHTERMLNLFGADIKIEGLKVRIKKSKLVSSGLIDIPADASSSAFFIALAALMPKAHLLIKSVGINPTRAGIIKALQKMGAAIKVSKCQSVKPACRQGRVSKFEPVADIIVKNSRLKGIVVKADYIPYLIDELPILMVAACLARGKTVIEGVSELRVKETDRINSMVTNLTEMGADIRLKMKKIKGVNSECLEIYGINRFKAAMVKSFGDHRTAMSAIVAGLLAEGKTRLDDVDCIDKSFPEFVAVLRGLLGRNCILFS